MRWTALLLAFTTLALSSSAALGQSDPAPTTPVSAEPLKAGDTMPELRFSRLDGSNVTLSSLRGQMVLINFWATWCGPCRAEIPTLNSVVGRYPKLKIIGIDADESKDTVSEFLKRVGTSYEIWIEDSAAGTDDSGDVLSRLQADDRYSIPYSVILDESGVVVRIIRGFNETALEKTLQRLFP
jgi:thiol-disulfide isomerase/thioredoxin